jgi:hypothetical protein
MNRKAIAIYLSLDALVEGVQIGEQRGLQIGEQRCLVKGHSAKSKKNE